MCIHTLTIMFVITIYNTFKVRHVFSSKGVISTNYIRNDSVLDIYNVGRGVNYNTDTKIYLYNVCHFFIQNFTTQIAPFCGPFLYIHFFFNVHVIFNKFY